MRVLIIRFSSFGDIFQALEAAQHLVKSGRTSRIDWFVREDFAPLLKSQFAIDNVLTLHRKDSVFKLIQKAWRMASDYDHVYDAHSNLRSLIVRLCIRLRWLLSTSTTSRSMIIRSKERIRRFLFFKLRLSTLPAPYRGAESFVRPLRAWIPDLDFSFLAPSWQPPELDASIAPAASTISAVSAVSAFRKWRTERPESPLIALAPSAAWPNKRWPIGRWRLFIHEWLKTSPESSFLLLGGPDDSFLNAIEDEFGRSKVFNAVAKTSLLESSVLLSHCDALVANDTGLLHVADRLLLPCVAIIGPTAFGYPVSPLSRVAEVHRSDLPCKPCSKDGRDKCTHSVQLMCLIDISPERVVLELKDAFKAPTESQNLL